MVLYLRQSLGGNGVINMESALEYLKKKGESTRLQHTHNTTAGMGVASKRAGNAANEGTVIIVDD